MAGKSFSVKDEVLTAFKKKCMETGIKESYIVNSLIEAWLKTKGVEPSKEFDPQEPIEEEAVEEQPIEEVPKPSFEIKKELCPKCGKEWDYQYCQYCGYCWNE